MILRKLIWTALVSVVSTASAALAVRLADRLWRKLGKGPPPPMPRWAKLLAGKPLKKGVEGRVGNVPV